jgi:hypothetical protein
VSVQEDEFEFDKCQLLLVREIARVVKLELQRAGVSDELGENLTERLTFQLATLLDGDHSLENEGRQLVPMIAFARNDERTELLGNPGGSWMHEYALGIAESVWSGGN